MLLPKLSSAFAPKSTNTAFRLSVLVCSLVRTLQSNLIWLFTFQLLRQTAVNRIHDICTNGKCAAYKFMRIQSIPNVRTRNIKDQHTLANLQDKYSAKLMCLLNYNMSEKWIWKKKQLSRKIMILSTLPINFKMKTKMNGWKIRAYIWRVFSIDWGCRWW